MDEVGVLPGAGEASVVEVDVSLLERPQLTFLFILLDGVERLLGRELELFARPLGDLAHEVEGACGFACLQIALEEGQVVPAAEWKTYLQQNKTPENGISGRGMYVAAVKQGIPTSCEIFISCRVPN